MRFAHAAVNHCSEEKEMCFTALILKAAVSQSLPEKRKAKNKV